MANNYTVSTHVTDELAGDTPSNSSLPSSVELIITPDAGYVVQASDFNIGNTLPQEITSVTFVDVGTPLTIANTIKVTAFVANWYVMPSSNVIFDIDIDGKAELFAPRLNFTHLHNNLANLTTTLTMATGGTATATTVGDVVTNICSIPIQANTEALVFTIKFTAASGFHFTGGFPSPSYVAANTQSWRYIQDQGLVFNADGQVTEVVWTWSVVHGSQEVLLSAGETINWLVAESYVAADRVVYNVIESVLFTGLKDEAILDAKDIDTVLSVSGSENSTYDLQIEDSNGLTYDFEKNEFTRSLTILRNEKIPLRQAKNLLQGSNVSANTHDIFLPAFFEGQAYNFSFTATVIPTGSTVTNAADGSANNLTTTLNQFGDITTTFTAATAADGVAPAVAAIKTIENRPPLKSLSKFNPTEFPNLNADNNGYFSYSQALGYSVTDTTASGFSGTTMTMSTSYVTKKVQVGDTVSHANISDGTRVSAVNVGGDAVVYTLNQAPASAVSGGQTITFTRVVGISRQPLVSDIRSTAPIVSFNGVTSNPTSGVSQNVTDKNTIQLSVVTDLTVGMLVEGDSIVGFPTITAIVGQNIVLSKKQTLSVNDTLVFSVAGGKLEIEDINVTGSGTADAKLNVSGFVDRVGIADIAAEVVLDNFISTFVTGVLAAVATTATCSLGGSVKISPLEVNSSSTNTLIIATIPSSGNGTTSLSTDSTQIRYKAPLTGTSDTITYTINDGVSTSAAANIVITLTP